jgi:hypothetical protein
MAAILVVLQPWASLSGRQRHLIKIDSLLFLSSGQIQQCKGQQLQENNIDLDFSAKKQ